MLGSAMRSTLNDIQLLPSSTNVSSPHPVSPASEGSETIAKSQGDDNSSKKISKGLYSFKVLAECPITIVTLLQAHQQENISANISILVPIIIKVPLLNTYERNRIIYLCRF
jgi:hypothetical protein